MMLPTPTRYLDGLGDTLPAFGPITPTDPERVVDPSHPWQGWLENHPYWDMRMDVPRSDARQDARQNLLQAIRNRIGLGDTLPAFGPISPVDPEVVVNASAPFSTWLENHPYWDTRFARTPRGYRGDVRAMIVSGWRQQAGMGAVVCDETGCWDDGTGGSNIETATGSSTDGTVYGPAPAGSYDVPLPGQVSSLPSGSTVTVGTSGGSSAQTAALIAQLAAQGLKIVQANTLPVGSMVLPNGTVVHQAAGYPVTPSLSANLQTPSGSTMLMLAAVAAFALLAFRRQ
ncbi:MAG: hypothetical protein U0Q18_25410 [Bryobacteraceae bacterium]